MDGQHRSPARTTRRPLASLHAASSAQIRGLTIGDADHPQRTLSLAGRPSPPLDPVSRAALQDCLRHREALRTLNPHVIVTIATRTGDSPAHQSYLTRVLRRAGTTPALCRQTRVSQLVTDLDPGSWPPQLSACARVRARPLPCRQRRQRPSPAHPGVAPIQPVRSRRRLAHLDANLCELEKEKAAPTWKKTFGFHPLAAFADHGAGAGGEPLAILLGAGNAGSNTAAEHIEVTRLALAQVPPPPAAPGADPHRLWGRHPRTSWPGSPAPAAACTTRSA